MAGKPLLLYFPAAGRGELSRLISAAGGLDIDDYFPGPRYKSHAGWFGSMPVVKHGNFSICQSSACEKYLASIAPKFKELTAQQVAMDSMFIHTLEDIRQGCYKVVFGDAATKREAPDSIPQHLDKYLPVLEGMVPENGFINGCDFPTAADMTLLNFAEACGPFQDSIGMAGNYDWETKFPKIKALVERAKDAPGVKEYLARTQTMKAKVNPAFMAKLMGKALGHALTFGLLKSVALDRGNQPPETGPAIPAAPAGAGEPELIYFPIAGRGELTRLIAAAGDLKIRESFPGEDWKTHIGFFGSMPILKHGNITICQSGAIETYVATIAPRFNDLTPQQRAFDDCFAATKEDLLAGSAKFIFGSDELKAKAPEEIPKLLDKFLSVIEVKTPEAGFIQGLEFPTTADLVLLNLSEAVMPFQSVIELAGGYDWQAKFPKIKANIERTKNFPSVKQYLDASPSMNGKF